MGLLEILFFTPERGLLSLLSKWQSITSYYGMALQKALRLQLTCEVNLTEKYKSTVGGESRATGIPWRWTKALRVAQVWDPCTRGTRLEHVNNLNLVFLHLKSTLVWGLWRTKTVYIILYIFCFTYLLLNVFIYVCIWLKLFLHILIVTL